MWLLGTKDEQISKPYTTMVESDTKCTQLRAENVSHNKICDPPCLPTGSIYVIAEDVMITQTYYPLSIKYTGEDRGLTQRPTTAYPVHICEDKVP